MDNRKHSLHPENGLPYSIYRSIQFLIVWIVLVGGYKLMGPDHIHEPSDPESMVWRFMLSLILCIFAISIWAFFSLVTAAWSVWIASRRARFTSSRFSIIQTCVRCVETVSMFPAFFVGLVLIKLVLGLCGMILEPSVAWNLYDGLFKYVLLCIVLAVADGNMMFLIRQSRAEIEEEILKPYTNTLLMCGNRMRWIMIEALKNKSHVILPAIRCRAPEFISGAIAVEYVFDVKGVGSYLKSVMSAGQGVVWVVGAFIFAFLLLWLLLDLCLGAVESLIRRAGKTPSTVFTR